MKCAIQLSGALKCLFTAGYLQVAVVPGAPKRARQLERKGSDSGHMVLGSFEDMARQFFQLLSPQGKARLIVNCYQVCRRAASMCSGTDLVIDVMRAVVHLGLGTVSHAFACDINASKQRWMAWASRDIWNLSPLIQESE